MAGYNELANLQMPSLADLMSGIRQKRQAKQRSRLEELASGTMGANDVQVTLPGGEQIVATPDGQMSSPRLAQLVRQNPMVRQAAETTEQMTGQPQGRLAQRRQQLMAEGKTAEEALQQMGQEGLIDPRLVQRMLRVPRAATQAGY
jgi:hypothetical protein